MGVSACSVALLLTALGSLVDYSTGISKPSFDHGDPLIVHIQKGESEELQNLTTDNEAVHSLPQEQDDSTEIEEPQEEVRLVKSPQPPADPQPVTDWHALANEAAKTSVNEYYRQEESRASMWKQSRSTMFQPAKDMVVKEQVPILSDVRFKHRSRVLGLGINVGSCFFGIPIAGVPVEKRSVGITVFVCS